VKAQRLVELLIKKKMTIAVVESCTGGAFMAELVRVPGVSEVFRGGMVAYSEEMKIKVLDVKPDTISRFGVVSTQVAVELAMHAKKNSRANICVAVTGYAGPTGDDVGKVCFGISINGKQYVMTKEFGNIGRGKVIDASVDFLLEWLCETI
jgi:PncC family amidohydrolase